MVTQLTTFAPSISCNITLKMVVIAAKHIGKNIVNKIHHKHYSAFVSYLYRVIHKSFRDFRPLRYISRDGHAEGEHVNRGTDIPSFCPTLQVALQRVWQELDYRIDICRVTMDGHIEHL